MQYLTRLIYVDNVGVVLLLLILPIESDGAPTITRVRGNEKTQAPGQASKLRLLCHRQQDNT